MEEVIDALREYVGVFAFAAALGLSLTLMAEIGRMENTLYTECLNSHNYYVIEDNVTEDDVSEDDVTEEDAMVLDNMVSVKGEIG